MKSCLPKILVLEDNLEIHLLLLHRLKPRNWNLFFAISNKAACAVLEQEKNVDLIVSDFQLKSETSAIFFRHLREENYKIPCVFYSSATREEIVVGIEYPHLFGIISKPHLESLIHVLDTLLDS